jgi:beta-lactamase regulating signal transducer with metallopeptidase domain
MTWPAEIGWLSLFAEYLIKSTLALTLALILVVLFRKRSASLRHFVLSLSLAGLLLLPVLPYLGIGWETALLPARPSVTSVTLAAPADRVPNGKVSGGPEHRDDIIALSSSSNTPEMLAHSELLQNQSGPFLKIAIPFIWSAGLIILLLRLAAGLFGAFRLTREGETVRDPCWLVLLERFLAAIHFQRKVLLKSHRDVLIPLTWGFIKPVVLIPAGHETWTEDQHSSALIHELSHVKRADFLVMVLVRLSLAVFWFNPLSWAVFRRLKNEQEEACDELVLRTGIKPSTYAADLLFFKSTAGARLSHFAALLGLFGFGRSNFNERLAAILKQKWTFQEVKMKTKIMLFCAVILAVALIGLARPSTPVAGEAEAAMSSLTAEGPNVSESSSSPAKTEIQAAEQGQAQEKKAQEKKQQEQAQEEQKKKEEKKQPVVVTIKEGEKHKHKIIITEGDKVKTIVVDRPIIIREGAEGKVFIVTPDGKELRVVEVDPAHLEIKADKLEVIEGGKILKVGKEGGAVYVIAKPAVDVTEAVAAVDLAEAVEVALNVGVPVAVKVAEPVKPHITLEPALEVAEPVKPHITWVARDEESLIREKLREIREKLKKVKEEKLDLQEVDEALADLEKELEKMSEEISRVALKHMEKPEVFTIVQKKGDEEAAAESKVDIGVDIAEHAHKDSVIVVAKQKGSFLLYYTLNPGGKGREAYEKIVARVEKELPEGFTLEPNFEEESGLITLKVNGPFEKGAPSDLVKKLADSIRDETKERKE